MSMARTAADLASTSDITFVHSARTPADIIFRAELARLQSSRDGFRVVAMCEQDSDVEAWHGPRGRLSLPLLREAVPDLTEREVFTCGPAPYMDAVRSLLAQAGVDPSRCHEESFDFTKAAAADGPVPGAPSAQAETAHTPSSSVVRRRTISCDAGTSILSAAALAGADTPVILRRGRLRHLQEHARLGQRRDEPRGRDPQAGDRAEQDPSVLLHPDN